MAVNVWHWPRAMAGREQAKGQQVPADELLEPSPPVVFSPWRHWVSTVMIS